MEISVIEKSIVVKKRVIVKNRVIVDILVFIMNIHYTDT